VLRRLRARVAEHAGVPLAEVGAQDLWQRLEVGAAVAGTDHAVCARILDEVARVIAAEDGVEVVSVQRTLGPFEGEAAPLPSTEALGAGLRACGRRRQGGGPGRRPRRRRRRRGVVAGELARRGADAMSARKARVEDGLRVELAALIAREVRDSRVKGKGLVGVTRVELNADLSVARVYVSVYGQDPDKAIEGLRAAAGFLRGPAGRRLNLSRPPELRFFHDQTAEVGLQLREIVQADERKARAAELEAEAPADPDTDPEAT
jgi:ribosome-binding factor A